MQNNDDVEQGVDIWDQYGWVVHNLTLIYMEGRGGDNAVRYFWLCVFEAQLIVCGI